MSSLEEFLQTLQAWKNSQSVIFVYWASGSKEVTFRLAGYIWDFSEDDLNVMGEGDVALFCSLQNATSFTVEPRKARVEFRDNTLLDLVLR